MEDAATPSVPMVNSPAQTRESKPSRDRIRRLKQMKTKEDLALESRKCSLLRLEVQHLEKRRDSVMREYARLSDTYNAPLALARELAGMHFVATVPAGSFNVSDLRLDSIAPQKIDPDVKNSKDDNR